MTTAHRTIVEKYSIENHLEFRETSSGLMQARLLHDSGGSTELYLYGAHVTSWKTPGGSEILFMSKESVFQKGAAIRGGIPLVFPQFGDGPLPKHGFARIHEWDVTESGISDRGEVYIKLRLGSIPEIYELWPHQFVIEYTITLGESLTTGLRVLNEGESPFSFMTALHTYFAVSDVGSYCIEGLDGCEYIDRLRESRHEIEHSPQLGISSMVDRVYLKTPRDLNLRNRTTMECTTIKKVGFKNAVVWNPWQEGARGMKDFGDEEYRSMLCIEAAHVDPAFTLAPGEFWIGVQVLHHVDGKTT
jgi:glucose-6-phosphate 1-epimerase